MAIPIEDITLGWHRRGTSLTTEEHLRAVEGYDFDSFFTGALGWMHGHRTADEVFSAAADAYKGTDSVGIGVSVQVWDGADHPLCLLFGDVEF